MRSKEKVEESQTETLSPEEFREFLRVDLRERVQNFAVSYVEALIQEEVVQLCGQIGARKERNGLAFRGGRQNGYVILEGQRVRIKKERVRKRGREIQLERYASLQDRADLGAHVERLMLAGISTRKYDRILADTEAGLGLSKSSVSREFVRSSRESLNFLNSRTFPGQTFWGLVLDGIEFGGSMVIVALGVDMAGKKHILGISEGSTENTETCLTLLRTLQERKVCFAARVLVIMDGSKALEKAVRHFFGEQAEIQLCYLHKMKNVLAKLPRRYHGEFCRRYRQAYSANDSGDAQEAMSALCVWLEAISFSAAESLRDSLDRLLTLHRVGMPSPLRQSFYTTNLIDSAFSNPRSHLNRVKRVRGKTDQVLRWVGSLLLDQESQFRKVRHHKYIAAFIEQFLENVLDRTVTA